MARMTVRGLAEARSALRAVARSLPAQVLEPAVRRALGPLEDRVQAEMPVASGAMVHHVEIRMSPTRRGLVHGEVAVRDIAYAAHVDLGTAETEADAFMQRAFDQEAPRTARDLERAIVAGLGRLAL